jgi:hypothetical protein
MFVPTSWCAQRTSHRYDPTAKFDREFSHSLFRRNDGFGCFPDFFNKLLNGRCLPVLHDKAFDVGIVTIAEDMTVRVSQKHAKDADQFFRPATLAYDGKSVALPEKFRPHSEFLSFHRNKLFEP